MHTLKKFIQYYAPYKPVFYFDLVCAAMISLVDLAFPQILRSLTKTLFAEEASQILSALLPITAALLLMYIIQALCKYYVSYQGHMMGARMERDMRKQLFDHYEKLSFSYYIQVLPFSQESESFSSFLKRGKDECPGEGSWRP